MSNKVPRVKEIFENFKMDYCVVIGNPIHMHLPYLNT